MALQFNPYPIGPWEERQRREQGPSFQDSVMDPINQGLGTLVDNQRIQLAQKRQAMLDEYLKANEVREKQRFASDYGTPIDPSVTVGTPTPNAARSSFMPAGMGQVATQSPLIEEFNKWRAGGMTKENARPEYMPALGRDERRIFYDNANIKPFDPQMAEADVNLKNARAEFLKRPPSQKDANFNQENRLRTEFLGQSKDFNDTASSYQRMIDSSRNPSAAGDLAMIFNYMKMLDPGSTVREGEFANAAASGSYGARFQAAAQKILTGQRLDESMRADFMERARDLYQGQLSRHKQREGEYQNLGRSYGADPSRITPNLATPLEGYGASGSAPKSTTAGQPDGTVKNIRGRNFVKRGGQWFPQ